MTRAAARQYSPFGKATLSAGIDASQTSIAWSSVSKLPALGPFFGWIFNSTDYDLPGDDPNAELVDATDINVGAKTGTISRGALSGYPGVAHNTGGKTYEFWLAFTTLDAARGQVIDAELDLGCSTGIADNASLIQAGIDYLAANGGGLIRFGEGTYQYATTIDLKAYVLLEGVGHGASTLDYTASSGNGFEWQADPVRSGLRDLWLRSTGASVGTGIASTAATLSQVTLDNVHISEFKSGVDLGHATAWFKILRLHLYGQGTGVSGGIGLDVGASGTPTGFDILAQNYETPIKLSGGPARLVGVVGAVTDSGSYLDTSIIVGDEIHIGPDIDSDVTVDGTTTTKVLGLGSAVRHTIATGAITLTTSHVYLYGEGSGAADDFVSATGHSDGEIYIFRLDPSQTGNITIKHDITKIVTKSAADVALTSSRGRFTCVSDGTKLIEI